MLGEDARRRLAATRFGDVRWLQETDSTNRALLDEARAGAPEGVVLVADHQTAGRGRLGRAWVAPPGASLLMSVLLNAPTRIQLVSPAIALAAADACAGVAGVEPAVKWPNDLLVDDRKLAGILAEASGGAVVVGLGLNVNWPHDPPDGGAALNRLAGREIDRGELLAHILVRLEDLVRDWDAVARDYRARVATIGRHVRVELTDSETFTGVAVDVTDQGHLVVETNGRRREIAAGDVFHVRSRI